MAHGLGTLFGAGTVDATQEAWQLGRKAARRADVKTRASIRRGYRSVYKSLEESQDRIANPQMYEKKPTHTVDHMGNKVPLSGLDSGIEPSPNKNNWLMRKYNLGKHETITGAKSWAIGGVLSGAMYGLSAWAMDDDSQAASDRMANVAKHGVAAGIDITADAGLTVLGGALATFGGPLGMMAGVGITAFNMGAGFLGMDAGSIAMRFMDHADEEYESAKRGPKFNMTQNTAMAMQRQLSNIAMSGSNLGEMMHN